LADTTIRPTLKFIRIGFIGCAIIALALEILYMTSLRNSLAGWFMLIPLLILLFPASHWLRWRFTTVTISGGRLRYETGIASRSTRTIQLSKVQDVRVDQSIKQRMFDVGNLSIETAGEASRLTLVDMDKPQALADQLMDHAQEGSGHI
jgi:uncharacterized membrane protein YdbT with pleckstrin-like domain